MLTIIDTNGNTVKSKKTGKVFEYDTYKVAFIARDVLERRARKHLRPFHVVGTTP